MKRRLFSCKYLPTNYLVKPIRTGGAAADGGEIHVID